MAVFEPKPDALKQTFIQKLLDRITLGEMIIIAAFIWNIHSTEAEAKASEAVANVRNEQRDQRLDSLQKLCDENTKAIAQLTKNVQQQHEDFMVFVAKMDARNGKSQ